jgi:hypothetical protein
MKKTPEDVRELTLGETVKVHDALVNELVDDEADRIPALGPEELERDLVAKGVDVAAEHAKADAIIAELTRSGELVPRPPRPPRTFHPEEVAQLTPEEVATFTPEQVAKAWEALLDWSMNERARFVASLSPEELDAELRACGLDPTVARAKGQALFIEHLRARRSTSQL